MTSHAATSFPEPESGQDYPAFGTELRHRL